VNRRTFFSAIPAASFAGAVTPSSAQTSGKALKISLAQWSLHKAIQSRLVTNLDFPRIARQQFGIEGLEFVNQLWEAPTERYITTLKRNMRDHGSTGVLIMCDGEGNMGSADRAERLRSATNHHRWVDIAAELGCTSIRTNMYPGAKQPSTAAEIDEFLKNCSESFSKLVEYGAPRKINVIIENHGGISSNPDVVVRLMKMVRGLGTLPDFGNFPKEVDKYEAVQKLMPFAKGVSMKCYDFSPTAEETTIDMKRMLDIVRAANYSGWVGIEYEGSRLTEFEGIQAAKRCLEKYI
jgi:L-ribulose-5-phosphate 3-epimerase